MSETQDLSSLATRSLKESEGTAVLLKRDGNYKFAVTKATAGHTKEHNKNKIDIVISLQEEDESGIMYKTITCEGLQEGGFAKGNPNIFLLDDLLMSMGRQDLRDYLISKGKVNSDNLATHLTYIATNLTTATKNIGYASCGDRSDGKASEPKYFIKGESYERSRSNGSWRRDKKVATGAPRIPGAVVNVNGAATSAVVSDAQASEV